MIHIRGSTRHHNMQSFLFLGIPVPWDLAHHPGAVTALPPLEATRGGAMPGAASPELSQAKASLQAPTPTEAPEAPEL